MSATRTNTANASSQGDTTVYTFASRAIGTAAADRIVLVCVQIREPNTTARTVTVTIAGNSATAAAQLQSGVSYAGIFYLPVPAGTTADVVVTISSTVLRCGIEVYALYGSAGTPYQTATSSASAPTASLDVPAGGVALGCAGADATATAWAGITADVDMTVEVSSRFSSASDQFASAQSGLTLTATFTSGSNPVGAFVTWGPATAGGSISNLITDWW